MFAESRSLVFLGNIFSESSGPNSPTEEQRNSVLKMRYDLENFFNPIGFPKTKKATDKKHYYDDYDNRGIYYGVFDDSNMNKGKQKLSGIIRLIPGKLEAGEVPAQKYFRANSNALMPHEELGITGDKICELTSLYVRSSARGQGVDIMLLAGFLKKTLELNMELVYIIIEPSTLNIYKNKYGLIFNDTGVKPFVIDNRDWIICYSKVNDLFYKLNFEAGNASVAEILKNELLRISKEGNLA